MSQQQAADEDLFGLDLVAENRRLRSQNSKLINGMVLAGIGGLVGIVFGITTMMTRPEPVRIALDAGGHAVPVLSLTKNDPPDSDITRRVADCMNGLFNHAFNNYQTTVEKSIGECFTGGGSESVRKMLDPFLQRMAKDSLNLSGTYVIQPFINSRGTMGVGGGMRNVFHVQGVMEIGYRGGKENGTTKPVQYAFQTDVVRVPYDSHISGTRLQNAILVPYER